MASKVEGAGFAIHTKDGDVVGSLIATKEKLAGGVEVEAPRIVSACPFFPDERQVPFWANGKDSNAVVQPIADIDKPSVR